MTLQNDWELINQARARKTVAKHPTKARFLLVAVLAGMILGLGYVAGLQTPRTMSLRTFYDLGGTR